MRLCAAPAECLAACSTHEIDIEEAFAERDEGDEHDK